MHDMRESEEEPLPCFLYLSVFTGHEGVGQNTSEVDGTGTAQNYVAHSSTTNPLTATALIYAFGAGITAGAGTRLVLQLLLDIGWV